MILHKRTPTSLSPTYLPPHTPTHTLTHLCRLFDSSCSNRCGSFRFDEHVFPPLWVSAFSTLGSNDFVSVHLVGSMFQIFILLEEAALACDWHRALAQVHKCISLQIILMKSVIPSVLFFKSFFFSANLETSFKSQTSSNKNHFDLSICILSNTSLRVFFIILFQKRGLFFQLSFRNQRMVSTDAFALWSFKSALFSLELMFLW